MGGLSADQLVAMCGLTLDMAESDAARRAALARLAGSERRRRGGVSPEHMERLEWRNERLVALWQGHPEWTALDASAAAAAISKAAQRYRSTTWRQQRHFVGPPPQEPARTFWEITANELNVPGKTQLFEVLRRSVQSAL